MTTSSSTYLIPLECVSLVVPISRKLIFLAIIPGSLRRLL